MQANERGLTGARRAICAPNVAEMTEQGEAVEANSRLTAATGAILLVLFVVEILTVIIGVKTHLALHVFIGFTLVPPLFLKLASVGRRFLDYYLHRPAFMHRGPPRIALRILGPQLVLVTICLFVSGFVLVIKPHAFGGSIKKVHAASAYMWLVLAVLHVVLHFDDIRRYALRDLSFRRNRNSGSRRRLTMMASALLAGVVLAASLMFLVSRYHGAVRPLEVRSSLYLRQAMRPAAARDNGNPSERSATNIRRSSTGSSA